MKDKEERKPLVPWFWSGSGRSGVELLGSALRARPALVGAGRGAWGMVGQFIARLGGSLGSVLTARSIAAGLAAVMAAAAIGAGLEGTGLWSKFLSGKDGRHNLAGLFSPEDASSRPGLRDAYASTSLGMLQAANAGALSSGVPPAGERQEAADPSTATEVKPGSKAPGTGEEAAGAKAAAETVADAANAAGAQTAGQPGLVPVPAMSARGGAGGRQTDSGSPSGNAGAAGAAGDGSAAAASAASRERPKPVLTAARSAKQAARGGSPLSARNAIGQLRAADQFSRSASGTGGEGAAYTSAIPFDGGAAALGGGPSGISNGGSAPGSTPGPASSGGPFPQERPGNPNSPPGSSGSSSGIAGKNLTPYQPWVTLATGLLAAAAVVLFLAFLLSRTVFGASWAMPLAKVAAVLAAGAAAAGAYITSQGQHLQGAVFTMAGAALAVLSWTAPLGDSRAANAGEAATAAAAPPAAAAAEQLNGSMTYPAMDILPPGPG